MKSKRLIQYFFAVTAITILAVTVTSCVREKFSAPAINNSDPAGIHATMTIAQFKQRYYLPNQSSFVPILISDSVILSGVVNGDDRTGNIYKQIIFQDSTGGLQVVADKSDLYNIYPTGTRVFVMCKGMYLYNYSGTLELGAYIDTTGAQPALGYVPAVSLSHYVVKGMTGLTVTPKHWTIYNLLNAADALNDQSTLIQLDSVEFLAADSNMTYADAIDKNSGNLTISDCQSPTPNEAIVRTSGYANFATAIPPYLAHGSITGIFTIYVTTSGTQENQVTVRDTTDVMMPMKWRICP